MDKEINKDALLAELQKRSISHVWIDGKYARIEIGDEFLLDIANGYYSIEPGHGAIESLIGDRFVAITDQSQNVTFLLESGKSLAISLKQLNSDDLYGEGVVVELSDFKQSITYDWTFE